MKKLLAVLMAFGMTATTASTVVACGNETIIDSGNNGEIVPPEKEVEITKVVTSTIVEKLEKITWGDLITTKSTDELIVGYVKSKIDPEVLYKTEVEITRDKETNKVSIQFKAKPGLTKGTMDVIEIKTAIGTPLVDLKRLVNDNRTSIEKISLAGFNKESVQKDILAFVTKEIDKIDSTIKDNANIDIQILEDGVILVKFEAIEGVSTGTVEPVRIIEKLSNTEVNLTKLVNKHQEEIENIEWANIDQNSKHEDILEFIKHKIFTIDSSIKDNATIDIEVTNKKEVIVKFKAIEGVSTGIVDPIKITKQLPSPLINLNNLIEPSRESIKGIKWEGINQKTEQDTVLSYVKDKIKQFNSNIEKAAEITIDINNGVVAVNFDAIENVTTGGPLTVIINELLPVPLVDLTSLVNKHKKDIEGIEWDGLDITSKNEDIQSHIKDKLNVINQEILQNSTITIKNNDGTVTVNFTAIKGVSTGTVDPIQITNHLITPLVDLTNLIKVHEYAIKHIKWNNIDINSKEDEILNFVKAELDSIDKKILSNSTITISNNNGIISIKFEAIKSVATGNVDPIVIKEKLPNPLVNIEELIRKNEEKIKQIKWLKLDSASDKYDVLKFINEQLDGIDPTIKDNVFVDINKNSEGIVTINFEHIKNVSIGDKVEVQITKPLPKALVNLTDLMNHYVYAIKHIDWENLKMEWYQDDLNDYLTNIINEIDPTIKENATIGFNINEDRMVTISFKAIEGKSFGEVTPITIIEPVKKSIVDLTKLINDNRKAIESFDWTGLKEEADETISSFIKGKLDGLNRKIVKSAKITFTKEDGNETISFDAIEDVSIGKVEPIKIIAKLPSAIVDITGIVNAERSIISNIDWTKEHLSSDNPKVVKEYLEGYMKTLLDTKITTYTTFDIEIDQDSKVKVIFKSIPNLSKGEVGPIIIKMPIQVEVTSLISKYEKEIKQIGTKIEIPEGATTIEALELIKPLLDNIDKDILRFTTISGALSDDIMYISFAKIDGKSFGKGIGINLTL